MRPTGQEMRPTASNRLRRPPLTHKLWDAHPNCGCTGSTDMWSMSGLVMSSCARSRTPPLHQAREVYQQTETGRAGGGSW
jgi:hypothetical protein